MALFSEVATLYGIPCKEHGHFNIQPKSPQATPLQKFVRIPCTRHDPQRASYTSPSFLTQSPSFSCTRIAVNSCGVPANENKFGPTWRRVRQCTPSGSFLKMRGLSSRRSFCGYWITRKLEHTRWQRRDGGKARASMKLDPGGGGGRGPNGDNRGIGRVVFNLALAGGLTYLTVTGKLGWLFDAFISLWLLVILVPIVGIVAFLWFADREIISSVCPNCGNPFQVLEFTMNDEQQFCPYCSQPFKLEGKQFVREGPRFSAKQSNNSRRPFGGFGQRNPSSSPKSTPDPNGVIVDVEAEVVDQD